MSNPVQIVREALIETWEELGQEHHTDYVETPEYEVLVRNLEAKGVVFP